MVTLKTQIFSLESLNLSKFMHENAISSLIFMFPLQDFKISFLGGNWNDFCSLGCGIGMGSLFCYYILLKTLWYGSHYPICYPQSASPDDGIYGGWKVNRKNYYFMWSLHLLTNVKKKSKVKISEFYGM